ncbi:AAA family ATPase [Phenylobacterium sp.]|uniref:AAA family ATPase n=1 Tax=Phenylobacterium sp. TaxID=1871053 RepID=UPI003D2E33B2
MRLRYVEVSGFRGYRDLVRIDFAPGFNIIDGRNGVGKSTVFDAVEFALTGELTKYDGAKAAGQSVADYIWWIGDNAPPQGRYVEVAWTNDIEDYVIRRTPLDPKDHNVASNLVHALTDSSLAPDAPLSQLCASTIIRDEHIASLSLDLKETERYALLRQAIGATDAETWIARAARISAQAKRKREALQVEVSNLANELANASRRIDELRSSLATDSALADAASRLRVRMGAPSLTIEHVSTSARSWVATAQLRLRELRALLDGWGAYESSRGELDAIELEIGSLEKDVEAARAELAELVAPTLAEASSQLANQARELLSLIRDGRRLGLVEHHCPLCAVEHTPASFETGLKNAEQAATRIDAFAAELALREQEYARAESQLQEAVASVEAANGRLGNHKSFIEDFERRLEVAGVKGAPVERVRLVARQLEVDLAASERDLQIVDTIRLNGELARSTQSEAMANDRLQKGQQRLGRARKAESNAAALHDAARRAATETLDLRISRILPLMTELYTRLKPHPVWQDIDYSIRGDLRRFLTLRVGEDLNPQFLFSSGQRRATGLAFLLSINLSLTWSRWRSILLDDPVQHVDDFRTIHLAEVLAQLVTSGRQIICAVEDPALADLMCRRLPIAEVGSAARMTLAPNSEGHLKLARYDELTPLPARALRVPPNELAS